MFLPFVLLFFFFFTNIDLSPSFCFDYFSQTPAVHYLVAASLLMHDPFAMRPFFGYNFGEYLHHWLSFGKDAKNKLPKIFHVNWFRKDKNGKFLWPGFGENCRVLDWVMKRINNEDVAQSTPIGLVPKPEALNLEVSSLVHRLPGFVVAVVVVSSVKNKVSTLYSIPLKFLGFFPLLMTNTKKSRQMCNPATL